MGQGLGPGLGPNGSGPKWAQGRAGTRAPPCRGNVSMATLVPGGVGFSVGPPRGVIS